MQTRHLLATALLLATTTASGDSLDVSLPDAACPVSEKVLPHASRKVLPLSYSLRVTPQRVLALDQYVKTWLKDRNALAVSAEVSLDTYYKYKRRASLNDFPTNSLSDISDISDKSDLSENADYAADYGYPSFTLGLRWNFNHATTMHRDAADWGEDMEVPYQTHLGDIVTLYGRFDRPLLRTRRLTAGYHLGTGVGYALSHYDQQSHIDNELIGTRLNIFFTTGLWADWHITRTVAITAGIDFSHHSNGALYRPNKGANYIGPFVGLKFEGIGKKEKGKGSSDEENEYEVKGKKEKGKGDWDEPWRRHPLSIELTVGAGGKTLNEEWQRTQFSLPATDPDYRTGHFAVYGAFSLQADMLYRYARRWSSGLGIDLFYGDYASRAARYAENAADHVSPWSVGLALKHEAHYGRLSARVGLGVYLYRHMGTLARQVEQPYYERVGLFYTLDRRSGLAIGFNVNAHKTKADFTELAVSIPFRL